jgi:hypothetical protein
MHECDRTRSRYGTFPRAKGAPPDAQNDEMLFRPFGSASATFPQIHAAVLQIATKRYNF